MNHSNLKCVTSGQVLVLLKLGSWIFRLLTRGHWTVALNGLKILLQHGEWREVCSWGEYALLYKEMPSWLKCKFLLSYVIEIYLKFLLVAVSFTSSDVICNTAYNYLRLRFLKSINQDKIVMISLCSPWQK